MPSAIGFSLVAFGSLFSIVDPFSVLPVFLALTAQESEDGRRKAALRAAITCAAVLSVFATIGPHIFTFFGITIPAFRIAGGILLFGVALEMLHAQVSSTKTTPEEAEDAAARGDVGIIPVGIPLLSGPGAIASVMMHAQSARGPLEHGGVYAAIVAVAAVSWLLLRFASATARLLGTSGMHIIGRLMGLILAAVAVQFILDGAHDAFPKLFG
jgi:multiple antibiotic resistance protein